MEDLTRQPRTNIDHEFTMTIEGFELQPTSDTMGTLVHNKTVVLGSDMHYRILEISTPCDSQQSALVDTGAWKDFTLAVTIGEWIVGKWAVVSLLRRWRDEPRGDELATLADDAHRRFAEAEKRVRAGDKDGIQPLLAAARAIAETDRSPGVRLDQGLIVPPRQNFHPSLIGPVSRFNHLSDPARAPQPGPLTIHFRGVFYRP